MMKVLPINQYNQNVSSKGVNKCCRYGIYSLITSASLFMFADAIDSFGQDKQVASQGVTIVRTIASILGMVGSMIGLKGIEQEDKNT